MTSRGTAAWILGWSLGCGAAAAGPGPAPSPWAQEAASRRDRLVEALREELQEGERGIVFLQGAPAADLAEFRQDGDFFYLTGVEVPGASLLITFDGGSFRERLFVPPRDAGLERWTGTALGPGGTDPNGSGPDAERLATMEATGFAGRRRGGDSGIESASEARTALSRSLAAGPAVLFLDYDPPGLDDPPTSASMLVADVRARYPRARVEGVRDALTRLRLVKSAPEIAAIRRAASITCEAQREAMRAARPGMKEFEVEAVVEYVFTRSGARFPAFPTIVGSGPNSCVLHYTRNDRTIEAGDLIVLDAGAEFGRYAADVTRTLPASGRFSDEQLRVYRAVLRAQEEARSLLRPGVRIRDLHERAAKVLEEAGLREAFLHGCCHFVGLDVHDRGSRDVELAPGMVLTIEPGAYLVDRGFGVRIEDTFLVTEDRHERLSACVPSAPEEVEAEMAAGKGVSRSGSASPPR